MPPKRLLMTVDTVGGVWRYSLALASCLVRRDWQVVLAALGPLPNAAQLAEIDALDGVSLVTAELPLDWAGADRLPMEAASARLAEIAHREACDLVQINTPLLAATVPWPIPVIVVAHGCISTWWDKARAETLDDDLLWHRDMTLEGINACDRLIAPTFAFADDLARTYGLRRSIEVIHHGSAPHLPAVLQEGEPFLFTAGRLWDEVKNISVLDQVAGHLEAPFLAAGSDRGPNGPHVQIHHLRKLGQLSLREMKHYLAQRPVFVSASLFEPFGLAALEAAQAGCALVLSDIPAFRELWGGAATFVDPHDPRMFVEAVEALLGDPHLRHRLGTAARCRAADYSLMGMADAMIAQYESVLRECPGPSASHDRSAIRVQDLTAHVTGVLASQEQE